MNRAHRSLLLKCLGQLWSCEPANALALHCLRKIHKLVEEILSIPDQTLSSDKPDEKFIKSWKGHNFRYRYATDPRSLYLPELYLFSPDQILDIIKRMCKIVSIEGVLNIQQIALVEYATRVLKYKIKLTRRSLDL